MSAIKKAVGAVTSTVFGGESKPATSKGEAISAADQKRQDEIDSQLKSLYAEQGKTDPSVDLFRQHLTDFLTQGVNNPNQIKDATSFIDQTFTNPAQAVVNQNVSDYQSQAEAKAAALGRNPNLDIATNQAIAGEGMRQNLGLQAQRGQMIGQRYDQNFNQNLNSLNAGMVGSGFLNNLGQQAFANRMALLNGRSSINQFNQVDRNKNVTTVGGGTTPGLLGTISSGVGQLAGTANAINGGISALGGIGSSIGAGITSGSVGGTLGAVAPLAIA